MATLPTFRVPKENGSQIAPYLHTGLDYAGPFFVKQGRGHGRAKRWLALFTCMNYRGVHLEIVHSLETQSFLMAMQRFLSSNASPKYLYMDNQRTFIKGEECINRWLKESDVHVRLQNKHPDIQFHYIPPSSPNFGGTWESMVKLVKRGLYDVIKPGLMTDEELLTAIKQVEA